MEIGIKGMQTYTRTRTHNKRNEYHQNRFRIAFLAGDFTTKTIANRVLGFATANNSNEKK